MAKDLRRFLRTCRNGWVLLSLGAIPAISSAQGLVDPTKPPDELSASPGAAAQESNKLRSIIISPTRRAAIINGQTVELGGKSGDDRLIEVSERGVVLQGERGRQVLTLFPDVKINKQTILPPMEDDLNNPVRKGKRVAKHAGRAGKREEK